MFSVSDVQGRTGLHLVTSCRSWWTSCPRSTRATSASRWATSCCIGMAVSANSNSGPCARSAAWLYRSVKYQIIALKCSSSLLVFQCFGLVVLDAILSLHMPVRCTCARTCTLTSTVHKANSSSVTAIHEFKNRVIYRTCM